MSTGKLVAAASADFRLAGMVSYFLNQFSVRARSPVASIFSNYLASDAMASGILPKSTAYFPAPSRVMALRSLR